LGVEGVGVVALPFHKGWNETLISGLIINVAQWQQPSIAQRQQLSIAQWQQSSVNTMGSIWRLGIPKT